MLSISAGNLDTSLNAVGFVTTDNSGNDDQGFATAYDSVSHDTIVAGQSGNAIALAAYKSDGTLDTGFGGGSGIVTLSLGTGTSAANAVAVDASGNIVVAGFATGSHVTGEDFAVARFTSSGALDSTFGGANHGFVLTDIAGADKADIANAITIDASGNIIVAGQTGTGTSEHVAVVRYNNAGTLDATFGSGGAFVSARRPTMPTASSSMRPTRTTSRSSARACNRTSPSSSCWIRPVRKSRELR